MKLWANIDPRLKKSLKILRWSVVGLVAAYIALAVVLALITEPGFFDGWFTLLIMGILGLVLTPVLLAVTNLIRYRLTSKYGASIPDTRLDKGLSLTAAVSGLVALALYLLETLWDADFKSPWDNLDVYAQIRGFAFAALMVCIIALAVNLLAQLTLGRLQKKRGEDHNNIRVKYTRYIAVCLLILTLLGNLLIPHTKGRYNDSGKTPDRGSVYYEAVLYDIILWDRTHTFGGDLLPEEEQKTRIYVFPFNCYTYDAKWDMKH